MTRTSLQSPTVRHLYKYAALSERSLAILLTGQIWYASPALFNDPFDSSIPASAKALVEARTKRAQRKLSKGLQLTSDPKLNQMLSELRDMFVMKEVEQAVELARSIETVETRLRESFHQFGVLSLSEDPANILMWAHYGAQHSGICFGFQRTMRNRLGREAHPVQYTSRRLAAVKVNPLYQKHSGWSYEREWRDIQKTGNALYPLPGKLIEVTCGAKMSTANTELVRRIVSSLNEDGASIRLRYASMHHTKFQLKFRDAFTTF